MIIVHSASEHLEHLEYEDLVRDIGLPHTPAQDILDNRHMLCV